MNNSVSLTLVRTNDTTKALRYRIRDDKLELTYKKKTETIEPGTILLWAQEGYHLESNNVERARQMIKEITGEEDSIEVKAKSTN